LASGYILIGEYGNGGSKSVGRLEIVWLPTEDGNAIPVPPSPPFVDCRPVNHELHLAMIEIIKTDSFEHWLIGLKDRLARFRIQARIDRLALGNAGDHKVLRDGISEIRVDHGPGYRVYFARRGSVLIVILAGGDKRTQDADIDRAIAIAREWKE